MPHSERKTKNESNVTTASETWISIKKKKKDKEKGMPTLYVTRNVTTSIKQLTVEHPIKENHVYLIRQRGRGRTLMNRRKIDIIDCIYLSSNCDLHWTMQREYDGEGGPKWQNYKGDFDCGYNENGSTVRTWIETILAEDPLNSVCLVYDPFKKTNYQYDKLMKQVYTQPYFRFVYC